MKRNALIRIADWQQERETLLAIRVAVFVEEQGVPLELEEDEHDARASHLLATLPEAGAVGTARLLDNGHIGRMAVRAPWRSRGIGSALLQALIEHAHDRGTDELFLNAQCSAESFYQRFGFLAEGDVFDDAGIPHRRMRLITP